MEGSLSGRLALVTGSSRGIGRSIALALAREGADVAVNCASSIGKAEEVAAEIRSMGRRSAAFMSDLALDGACDGLYARVAEQLGSPDILILNASLQIKKRWTDITPDEFERQTRVNYRSSLRLMQLAVPPMAERGWGRVVAIGSVQERKPHPEMLVYSSSKCAQTGLILSLSQIYAPHGVTFNSVAPGVIATDRNSEALSDPVYAKKVSDSIPMGYYGEPDDVAPVVATLCGDGARYVTGQNIFVDGGKSF